ESYPASILCLVGCGGSHSVTKLFSCALPQYTIHMSSTGSGATLCQANRAFADHKLETEQDVRLLPVLQKRAADWSRRRRRFLAVEWTHLPGIASCEKKLPPKRRNYAQTSAI